MSELSHFGVKGMRWGKRKAKPPPMPTKVEVRATPGQKLKTSGGANLKAHQDAKTAAIAKQKARKSSTDSLSDQELRALVNRMNLEQQYRNLMSQDPANQSALARGKKKVDKILGQSGKQEIVNIMKTRAKSEAATAIVTALVKR